MVLIAKEKEFKNFVVIELMTQVSKYMRLSGVKESPIEFIDDVLRVEGLVVISRVEGEFSKTTELNNLIKCENIHKITFSYKSYKYLLDTMGPHSSAIRLHEIMKSINLDLNQAAKFQADAKSK